MVMFMGCAGFLLWQRARSRSKPAQPCPIICDFRAFRAVYQGNGRGGIRTHGGLPHARFRVECLKPDSATLPFLQDRYPANRFRKERVYYEARAIICKSTTTFEVIPRTGRS